MAYADQRGDGNVVISDFLAWVMAEDSTEVQGPPKARPKVSPEVQQKFHSIIRWNKPLEEVADFMRNNPGASCSQDPQNGNYPLHIAVQNGHRGLSEMLTTDGVDLNAQNGKGQTALHMARAYDFYWLAKFLIENGASRDIKNNDGHAADTGID